MPDEKLLPAQRLVRENDHVLSVTEIGPFGQEGITQIFNFMADQRTTGGVTQNFRDLGPREAAEAEVMRERFKEMGGKPRLSPTQAMNAGGWH